MKAISCGLMAAALLAFLSVRPAAAVRFEIVPEEKTVLTDDSDAIVLAEYGRRARDSMAKQRPRTAAAELKRVATLAGRTADSTAGEARDAFRAIQTQALKLAYAAESQPAAALRPIRDFTMRVESFLEGERAVLEAREALTRGELEGARAWLTVAAQQLERRAPRAGKDRKERVEEIGGELRGLAETRDALEAADAGNRLGELVQSLRELASPAAAPKEAVAEAREDFSGSSARKGGTSGKKSSGKGGFGSGRTSTRSSDYESSFDTGTENESAPMLEYGSGRKSSGGKASSSTAGSKSGGSREKSDSKSKKSGRGASGKTSDKESDTSNSSLDEPENPDASTSSSRDTTKDSSSSSSKDDKSAGRDSSGSSSKDSKDSDATGSNDDVNETDR